jgi:DNA-binding transcriptional LysR family regulator
MNWLGLEAFASLSQTLSFTQTALKIGVTQPNISKLISNLEAEMGVSLFNRNRKQVALTPAGIELRDIFMSRYSNLRELLTQFQSHQKGLAGTIRIGCLPELGINLVFKHVLKFQEENPDVHTQILYAAEAQIINGLEQGRLDFGICARDEALGFLRAYPLITENIRIFGTPKSIRKLEAGHWERAPWVSPEENDSLAAGFLKTFRKKLPFQETELRLVANSHRSMCEALVAEIGFAVLPEASAESFLSAKLLAPLPGISRRDQLYLLTPEVDQAPQRIIAMRDHFFKLKKQLAGMGN